jgi:hypothetical protein
MKPSNLLLPAVPAAGLIVGGEPRARNIPQPPTAKEKNMNAKGRYGAVNGLKMYYQVHGTGPPIAGKMGEEPVDFAAPCSTRP